MKEGRRLIRRNLKFQILGARSAYYISAYLNLSFLQVPRVPLIGAQILPRDTITPSETLVFLPDRVFYSGTCNFLNPSCANFAVVSSIFINQDGKIARWHKTNSNHSEQPTGLTMTPSMP